MPQITCPRCSQPLIVGDHAAVRCPKCRTEIVVKPSSPAAAPSPASRPKPSEISNQLPDALPDALPVEDLPEVIPVEDLPDALPVDEVPSARLTNRPESREPAPPRRKSRRPDDVSWWTGTHNYTGGYQAGVIVIRADLVAFLPTEPAKNFLSSMAFALVTTAALRSAGYYMIKVNWANKDGDPLRHVEDLWYDRPDDFPEALRELAAELRGMVWSVKEASVAVIGKRGWLIFVKDRSELRGRADPGAKLDRLLENWEKRDPPLFGDLMGMLFVTLVPFLLTVGCLIGFLTGNLSYGPVILWGVITGLLLMMIGGKVAWVLLRRKGKKAGDPPQVAGNNPE